MYESGADDGKFYSLNVPLKDGIDDQGKGSSTKNFRFQLRSKPLPPVITDKVFASCQSSLCPQISILFSSSA